MGTHRDWAGFCLTQTSFFSTNQIILNIKHIKLPIGYQNRILLSSEMSQIFTIFFCYVIAIL